MSSALNPFFCNRIQCLEHYHLSRVTINIAVIYDIILSNFCHAILYKNAKTEKKTQKQDCTFLL